MFILIAVRQVGRWRIRIWHAMLGGALAVLLTGQITLTEAARSINTEVIVFLAGMFVVGEALHESGYLVSLTHRFLRRATTVDSLVFALLFGFGLFSALLMNDTLAIIGTPLMLYFSRKFLIPAKLLLLTLCFAITTGSVLSPIGNPQNLLVAATSGMSDPFVTFFRYLAIPTFLSLLAAYFILRLFYRKEFSGRIIEEGDEPVRDEKLTILSKVSLILIIVLVGINIAASFMAPDIRFPLTVIALLGAAPVLLFSPKRIAIIRGVDWRTLVFFAAMFVLMASVFSTGFFQSFVQAEALSNIPAVITIAVIMSQFISNVPFVALFQPVFFLAGTETQILLALSAGATIAGNLTILGAASNVIVIQNAEREGSTISFFEFFRVGLPLTVVNILIYSLFLSL